MVIHIVSNLIWNNPGQGGESAGREHETVLASLKRQQRRLGRGVNQRFKNHRRAVIRHDSANRTQDTKNHTVTKTHFYANMHIPKHTHINKSTRTLQVINWSAAFSSVCGVCTVPSLWQLVFVTETLLLACRGHMTMDIRQRERKN